MLTNKKKKKKKSIRAELIQIKYARKCVLDVLLGHKAKPTNSGQDCKSRRSKALKENLTG
jgi:hypothetical protein